MTGTHENGKGPVDLVLFDLGSTLIYFDGSWPMVTAEMNRVLVDALNEHGCAVDAVRFVTDYRQRREAIYGEANHTWIERSTESIVVELLQAYGVTVPQPAALRQIMNRYYAVSQAHWRLEEDAHETLDVLRANGCRLGLISNASDEQDVLTLMEMGGLRDYFEFVLVSAAAGIRKPHPGLFQSALEHYGAQPRQAVMVGDTLDADISGAHNAGMPGIWIYRRVDSPENRRLAEQIRPDASIAALSELPGVLSQWNNPS